MARTREPEQTAPDATRSWTFFTNHAHVLFCLARDPRLRLRDLAVQVGITERAVQRIVSDLESSGYLRVVREGRRNRYRVEVDAPLRHVVEGHCTVGELIDCVLSDDRGPRTP